MRKKCIAFLLCISILLSMVMPLQPVAAKNTVQIVHDGEVVSQIVIGQSDKEVLTAQAEGAEVLSYQWQILLDAEATVWVDIYDKTTAECEISYAVVNNMLDAADSTYVRCAVEFETEMIYSDAVCVSVLQAEEVSSQTPAVFRLMRAAAPMAEAESAYVTITIQYLDQSSLEGQEASIYSPYVATIEKGSSFHQDVVSPTFLGFAPYYDANQDGECDDNASVIKLSYNAVDSNVVIKVYYKPIEVNYAVRYFFQNINDDLYTEDVSRYHTHKAETGTIISDEELRRHAGDTTGFEKLYHYPESVAADGSTVFECYYDRNYYLVQFDLNGGYGVEPIYARYATPFVVNTPVRHGYTFAGWDLLTSDTDGDGTLDTGDGNPDQLPSTIPAESRYYRALWQTVNTTYTVVYWRENADDDGYSYWGNVKKNATSASYVDGTDTASMDGMADAEYFTFNDALSEKGVLVEGDGSTIVNVYYTRNYYTITFKATGLCTIPENHSHGNDCYTYQCGSGQHVHTAECLVCTIPVHVHGEDCCILKLHNHNADCCSIEYHVHDATCCTKEEHAQHDETCCTVEVHEQHTKECWGNVDVKQNGAPRGAPENPAEGQVYKRNRSSYIYINGAWYSYKGSETSGSIVKPSCHTHGDGACNCAKNTHTHGDGDCACDKAYHDHLSGNCNVNNCSNDGIEHTHGDGNCTCAQQAHQHEEICYNCGATQHTHTANCLRLICGITENHTHSSRCSSNNSTNTVKIVHRKYQQSLADIWPITDDNGKTYDNGERWDPSDTNLYSEVLVYISTMPADDFTLTLNTSNNTTKTMNYYLQVLPGESYDQQYNGYYYKLDNTIKANYGYITKAEDFFDIKGFTQYASNPAFSNNGQINNSTTANFYYHRTKHKLQFSNNGTLVSDREAQGIMYQAPLKEYNFSPAYPNNLEPNAYYFAGWYTSPGCYDGTEVNWETLTMPEGDLLLYAKWVPKTHAVNFFKTYDEMLAYEAGDTTVSLYASYPQVSHGQVVGSVTSPTQNNANLIFAGWFYIENGQKKAYAPLDMPINRDMNIFADWSSSQPQPYRIQYVLESDPAVKVADDTIGYAYGGSTRTFTAKAGNPYNQLYEAYNNGFFPTVGSHSITMQYEEDKENPVKNVYTFSYVQAKNIQYTVRYVNKENNTLLEEETVHYTEDAVVTERFKAFENMVPDAFYKRLVISVRYDEETNSWVGTEDNVITFYYTPNQTSAYYAVHYMMEKLGATEDQKQNYAIDGSGGYEESVAHIEGIADIGSTVSIEPQTFTGFQLLQEQAVNVVDGEETSNSMQAGHYNIEITNSGTELYLFYERLEYDYTVHYYQYNTTTSLEYDKNGTATYGTTVTENAMDITGWTCVSATTQTIMVRDEEQQNVIIFYYSPVQYVVEYVAVPPEGGWLSRTIEVITGEDDFQGSVPMASAYYKFEGWYLDEACTKSATEYGTIDATTGLFIPAKEKLSETERNIFYAKFVPQAGDLTIIRQNAAEESQVFVYEVKNTATGEAIYVTIVGNGSVTIHDLLLGEYTITQQNDWSWRHSDSAQTVSHQNPAGTTVQFSTAMTKEQWLNGNSSRLENQKKGDNEG